MKSPDSTIRAKKLKQNHKRSTRKLSKEAHVSLSTIQGVLANDLNVKPYKITKRQLLFDEKFEKSKVLLNKHLDGT